MNSLHHTRCRSLPIFKITGPALCPRPVPRLSSDESLVATAQQSRQSTFRNPYLYATLLNALSVRSTYRLTQRCAAEDLH